MQNDTIFKLLYPTFPRQVAIPYRITVSTPDEFYATINKYKDTKRVFASLYNYTGAQEYDKAFLNVDKIFFDFDGDYAYADTCKFVRYLIKCKLRFLVLYSGGGFHVYLFADNGNALTNVKGTIASVQRYFKAKLGIRSLDEKIIGDCARVVTIPLTWNHRRRRYCIPLTLDDLMRGEEYIQNKALKQSNPYDYTIYGQKNINLTNFDINGKYYSYYIPTKFGEFLKELEYDAAIESEIAHDKILQNFPLCVSALLVNGKKMRVGWSARYLIIVYMRDSGILIEDAENIINHYLTTTKRGKTEAYHCIVEEKQLERIYYMTSTAVFPCCERIKSNGLCPVEDYCNHSRKYGSLHVVKIYK